MTQAAIGIDVGGTATKGAVVDAQGRVLARAERTTDPSAGTKGILSLLDDLSAGLDVAIAGVGVGVAGFVDVRAGAVTFSPNLVYDDPHIAAAVANHLRAPVVVDNDANAAVWGERCFGTAAGKDDVAMLTLGTGVGSGFVVAGRILHGSTGAGAEFGHTIVDLGGPLCTCGLRGCLEQFASGNGIARLAREALVDGSDSAILDFAGGQTITAVHVARAAREMDELARKVLRQAGHALAVGLSNIVNVFDPDVIVLAGSAVHAGEPFLGPARDRLSLMMTEQRRRPVRLDVSVLGDDAGIIGAAALVLQPDPSRRKT